ncbi:hypothetical protein EON63_04440 [archaeon]|nr:MAG: hypothetical protein EON63_04440 [archaeon]
MDLTMAYAHIHISDIHIYSNTPKSKRSSHISIHHTIPYIRITLSPYQPSHKQHAIMHGSI